MSKLIDLKATVEERGWASASLPPEVPLPDIARGFGIPNRTKGDSPVVDILTIRSRDKAPPNSLSHFHGTGAFPYHTDYAHLRLPPRYVLLRCIDGGGDSRPTNLISVPNALRRGPSTRSLYRDLWVVRGRGRPFLATILSDTLKSDKIIFRYDPHCMSPLKTSSEAAHTVSSWIEAGEETHPIEWMTGLLLIIDNWRILHARASGGTSPSELRTLERCVVWENLP